MSDYPDWQADNEPLRAALLRLHHLQRTTGQIVPEAKEQFFATLQQAYFLIPNQGPLDDPDDQEESSQNISFYFEPIEGGLMLSVFSSVSEARAFFGDDYELHRVIQSAPDFFGSIVNVAEVLEESGDPFAGIVLDRASENFYFFEVSEIVSLAAGGRVLGPAQQVRIENQQIHIGALPAQSPLTAVLLEAFRDVMNAAPSLEFRELWAFWLTLDGKHEHLGLAVASARHVAVQQLGPLLEAKWQELGPKLSAFDLMPLNGPQEREIRAIGTLLWSSGPPKKRSLWSFLKPK